MLPNAPAACGRRGPTSIEQFCRATRPAALVTVQFSVVGATNRRSLLLLFTYSSRRRLFINRMFFEQPSPEQPRPFYSAEPAFSLSRIGLPGLKWGCSLCGTTTFLPVRGFGRVDLVSLAR